MYVLLGFLFRLDQELEVVKGNFCVANGTEETDCVCSFVLISQRQQNDPQNDSNAFHLFDFECHKQTRSVFILNPREEREALKVKNAVVTNQDFFLWN